MDDYEKIEVVGRGAFGVVTLYLQKSTQRKVVIKHIPVQQMSAEEKEGSVVEAKVLAMLHHPNIIAYYDSFLEEKSLAIVMEYAPELTMLFPVQHVPTIMMKILKGSYEPVPDRYSAALRGLLDQMLQREPSLRPTVRQLWGHPVLLPVIVNLCLTIGSLPCVAE
ncbi:hypothetical protein HPB48_024388 [Haemaphysalis longicornis]|uniref:non-specific serine/threonine protein kinase n=1 Tax=Haemaphysalis longicornis TaxID=44386 RepID=A0A9J6GXZ0_HAELO|nr:hypothetical protein HPB48_024388 [Haemaphysalis longicornis]